MSPAETKRRAARVIVRSRKPSSEVATAVEKNPQSADRAKDAGEPIIIRTTDDSSRGTQTVDSPGYTLGYIVAGSKHIHRGETFWEATAGDIFFLDRGRHQVENIPARGRGEFEQIVFNYSPEHISRALALLVVNYGIDTCVNHSCDKCMRRDHVIATCRVTVRQFFDATLAQMRVGLFDNNPAAEQLALTNLLFHVVTQPEGCLRTRVLGSADPEKELMERIIHEYVYTDLSLEELARRNNRSLSGFKKKFKEYYGEAPHRWVVRQRLINARLLVIQSNKTTLQISHECHFRNCSHFIALFREEYGLTPFQYRKKYRSVNR